MTTIAEFILARVQEEQDSFALPEFDEIGSVRGPGWGSRGDCRKCGAYQWDGNEVVTEEAWWSHVADAHDYANAFDRWRALRLLVELHAEVDPNAPFCKTCGEDGYTMGGSGFQEDYPCTTLGIIARIWADHPDHDAGWAA